jgi:hypothetical protein
MDANERFEILGELYHRRFHRLRPGKDEAAASYRDSGDDENIAQFKGWYGDGCVALDDALECISRLNYYITKLEDQL